jgi:hypothetical protein
LRNQLQINAGGGAGSFGGSVDALPLTLGIMASAQQSIDLAGVKRMKAHRNGKERLEERVARLEAEVKQLQAAVKPGAGLGWESIVGSHQGSEAFEAIVHEMQRLREEDYARAASEPSTSSPRRKKVKRVVSNRG